MGSSKSKNQQPDTSVAMENYIKELGEKYQVIQEKIDDIAEGFTGKNEFDSKFVDLENTFKGYSNSLQHIINEETKRKDQKETLSKRIENIELEAESQKERLLNLEKGFAQRVQGYERELREYRMKIAALEKQVADSTEDLRIFRLNKMARINGIRKEDKTSTPFKPQKKSQTKSVASTQGKNSTISKRKNTLCISENEDSSIEGDKETENKEINYFQMIVEDDKSKSMDQNMKSDSKKRACFEEVDLNTL